MMYSKPGENNTCFRRMKNYIPILNLKQKNKIVEIVQIQ
jgi:hypothetical protein